MLNVRQIHIEAKLYRYRTNAADAGLNKIDISLLYVYTEGLALFSLKQRKNKS